MQPFSYVSGLPYFDPAEVGALHFLKRSFLDNSDCKIPVSFSLLKESHWASCLSVPQCDIRPKSMENNLGTVLNEFV